MTGRDPLGVDPHAAVGGLVQDHGDVRSLPPQSTHCGTEGDAGAATARARSPGTAAPATTFRAARAEDDTRDGVNRKRDHQRLLIGKPMLASLRKPPAPHIHNERIKLFATFLNNLAVACFVIGVLTPEIAQEVKWVGSLTIGWSVGFLLHGFALLMLKHLSPPDAA